MNDLFLKVDGVNNEEQARTWSINAALQRNKVYKADEDYWRHKRFGARWAKLLSEEAQTYRNLDHLVSDEYHCNVIARIADALERIRRNSSRRPSTFWNPTESIQSLP